VLVIKCATLHDLVGTHRLSVRVSAGVYGRGNSYALAVVDRRCS